MQWTVITQGGLEIYVQIFNAIATITGQNGYLTLLRLFITFGLVFVLFEMSVKLNVHQSIRWFAVVFLIYGVALGPKVTLNIEDTLRGQERAVDNVPLGVALPATVFTKVGYKVTQAMESIFNLPNDLVYSKTGMVMGSQLMVAAGQFEVTDLDFRQDLSNFTRQCIFYDLLLGKYLWSELASSNDIWRFVKTRASPARAFKNQDGFQTCQDGVLDLENRWEAAIDHAAAVYGARFYGQWHNADNAKAALLKALPLAYKYFTDISLSASSMMQQNMMANLIRQGAGQFASHSNAPAAAQALAIERSDAQMRASLQISGSKAAYWLSIMRLVLEGLLFGAFVLLLPLFLLPKGLSLLKHYLTVLLTLEMIAPLYAITHLIFMTTAASSGAAGIQDPSGDGLNLVTQMGFAMIHQDMAALAGRVSLSLPFIAYALVAGSGYALMQFANSVISGPAESAAGTAAGEITTGNYSFGNSTLDNQNIANNTRYHRDENITSYGGAYDTTADTGGTIRITPDGRLVFNAAPGMSNTGSQMSVSFRCPHLTA
ncbi:MAG: conjugal transfer protein TraG N-terminal domain-containing protein [Gammaproteobacteria bacterium]